jgi:hypothetical protein
MFRLNMISHHQAQLQEYKRRYILQLYFSCDLKPETQL